MKKKYLEKKVISKFYLTTIIALSFLVVSVLIFISYSFFTLSNCTQLGCTSSIQFILPNDLYNEFNNSLRNTNSSTDIFLITIEGEEYVSHLAYRYEGLFLHLAYEDGLHPDYIPSNDTYIASSNELENLEDIEIFNNINKEEYQLSVVEYNEEKWYPNGPYCGPGCSTITVRLE